MIITEAAPSHLHELEDLYIRSVKANPQGFVQNLRFHGDIKDLVRHVQSGAGSFAVGLVENRVVAIGGLSRDTHDPSSAEMCKLHVDRAYQGRGYGRQMGHHLFSRAGILELKRIHLHVTTSQYPAIKLYQKLGFQEDRIAFWEAEFEAEKLCFETLYMYKDLE